MSNTAVLQSGVRLGRSFDIFGQVARFFDSVNAAARCSAAIEANRRPALEDLKTLGLEQLNFEAFAR